MALNHIKVGTQVRLLREVPSERIVSSNLNHDPRFWTKAKLKLKGKTGVVTDILHSSTFDCDVYRVHLDGYERLSRCDFVAEDFEPDNDDTLIRCEVSIDRDENKLLLHVFTETPDAITERIHYSILKGSLAYDPELQFAQALSYVAHRYYDNQMRKGE